MVPLCLEGLLEREDELVGRLDLETAVGATHGLVPVEPAKGLLAELDGGIEHGRHLAQRTDEGQEGGDFTVQAVVDSRIRDGPPVELAHPLGAWVSLAPGKDIVGRGVEEPGHLIDGADGTHGTSTEGWAGTLEKRGLP